MNLIAQQRVGNGPDVFGFIKPPPELQPILNKGGAEGINFFLNNIIALIYIVAAVVFVFMMLWGALEWISSGGDKEKVGNAQKRITHAIIGIVLFAITFAIIQVVGIFTGFTFFTPR
jgi:hypothetical protein